MKFVEDRFGEVNWKNMWMQPTVKTSLQFLFRSFTWMLGSWKALSKAGMDIGKLGWFKVKDLGAKEEDKRNYELTEKGMWGISAVIVHMMTVQATMLVYYGVAAATGGEVPDEEDTPFLTKLLFPRIDPEDPSQRVSIPSYVTELYKIMRHLGFIGSEAEYLKLVSGRTNSLISQTLEAAQNSDWQGVRVREKDDSYIKQTMDTVMHVVGVMPISVDTMLKGYERKGLDVTSAALSIIGMTSAPAAAKRTAATNKAFHIRQEQFSHRLISEEAMEVKTDLKRAVRQYGRGNKAPLNKLRASGKTTQRKIDNAMKGLRRINGRPNPMYESDLKRALGTLTTLGAIEVWPYMNDVEKKLHRRDIIKKYNNSIRSKNLSREDRLETVKKLKKVGIIR
jgi:hypothetical protein